jgi:hypothetical protein
MNTAQQPISGSNLGGIFLPSSSPADDDDADDDLPNTSPSKVSKVQDIRTNTRTKKGNNVSLIITYSLPPPPTLTTLPPSPFVEKLGRSHCGMQNHGG